MFVIVQLQNLPLSANCQDIRRFFYDISIRDGGVVIVGGEMGYAFIACTTDEDARRAVQKNGGTIKDVQIMVKLSDDIEMRLVMDIVRIENLLLNPPHEVISHSDTPSLQQTDRIITANSQPKKRGCSPSPERSYLVRPIMTDFRCSQVVVNEYTTKKYCNLTQTDISNIPATHTIFPLQNCPQLANNNHHLNLPVYQSRPSTNQMSHCGLPLTQETQVAHQNRPQLLSNDHQSNRTVYQTRPPSHQSRHRGPPLKQEMQVAHQNHPQLAKDGQQSNLPIYKGQPPSDQMRQRGPPVNQEMQVAPQSQTQLHACISLKGLPEAVTNRDIVDLLSQINVKPLAVHIIKRPDQTPSGDAFAEFGSQADMNAALQLHGYIMRGNCVSIQRVPFHEMSQILVRTSLPPLLCATPFLRTPQDADRAFQLPPVVVERQDGPTANYAEGLRRPFLHQSPYEREFSQSLRIYRNIKGINKNSRWPSSN